MNQRKLRNKGYSVLDTIYYMYFTHIQTQRKDSGHTQVKLIKVIISYKGTWLRLRCVLALSEFEFF